MIDIIDELLSILTIVAQVIIIVAILALIIKKVLKKQNGIVEFISDNAFLISFMAALISTVGSLFYSEIAGYEPCKLCWLQRIVMYPQVITLGLALKSKNSIVLTQSIILSAIGAIIAFYHYLGQRSVIPELPCGAVGYSVSCSKFFVLNYGYITIPMMAFSAFMLILVASLIKKYSK